MTPRHAPTLAVLAALVLGAPAPGAATAPTLELGLPLRCTPGEDCWVVRHVDRDPGPGFADHRCGALGSDGHDGTDFALPDPARMRSGVLAAAAGVVRAVRDGVPDQPPNGRLQHEFGRQNCGNGVLVAHEAGWETQYCHLHQGSVRVRPGEAVAAGQELGLVGMSGEANFPHVHLSVRHDGRPIDPFSGLGMEALCAQAGTALWRRDLQPLLEYREVPIAVVGLTDRVPEHEAIVAGTAAATALGRGSPALVGYVLGYGLRPGDRIGIAITGPDGAVVGRARFTVEEEAPRATRSAGRKAPPEGWPPGTYRVEASVERDGRRWSRSQAFALAQ
jgi:hypothetical protein